MREYALYGPQHGAPLCTVFAENVDDALQKIEAQLGKRLALGEHRSARRRQYALREIVVNCYYTSFAVYERSR